ncbi:MAG: hypothetical protein HFI14_07520 [Lachnospiraceae bacterium]|nr:hypothetical protein [Lachnospiraceae bacterium]
MSKGRGRGTGAGSAAQAAVCALVWNVSDMETALFASFGHFVRLRRTGPFPCPLQSTQRCTSSRLGGASRSLGCALL